MTATANAVATNRRLSLEDYRELAEEFARTPGYRDLVAEKGEDGARAFLERVALVAYDTRPGE